MQLFLALIIPGTHLYKQKKWLLGDLINLIACFCTVLTTYLFYTIQTLAFSYPLAILIAILLVNFWQIKQFEKKIKNPTYNKLLEIEFKDTIQSFLIGNNEATMKSLKKIASQTPCPHELEIFLLHLLQCQGNLNDGNKLKSYLDSEQLSTTAKSLYYSISKSKSSK